MSELGGPDEKLRDEWEGRLTRKVSSLLAKKLQELKASLGDGTELPESFWESFKADLGAEILPTLGEIAKHSAGKLEASVPDEKKSTDVILRIEQPNTAEWIAVVRQLQEQQALAIKANADAIGELAKAMARQPAPVIHVEPIIAIESPDVSVDMSPLADAMKARDPSPQGPTSRHEDRVLTRDQKGQVVGSQVEVTYHYGEGE